MILMRMHPNKRKLQKMNYNYAINERVASGDHQQMKQNEAAEARALWER